MRNLTVCCVRAVRPLFTMRPLFIMLLGFLLLGSAIGAEPANEPEIAGTLQYVKGDVKLLRGGGEPKTATQGMTFVAGDRITTGSRSFAQLKMADDGSIYLWGDSSLQISTFQYKKSKGGRVIFNLIRGAFRSVTGAIGMLNHENYKVLTPTASIGIRGTDHEPIYIPSTGWSGAPSQAPGTYDRVYTGQTVLITDAGILIINPGQTGYSGNVGKAPYTVPNFAENYVHGVDRMIRGFVNDPTDSRGRDRDTRRRQEDNFVDPRRGFPDGR